MPSCFTDDWYQYVTDYTPSLHIGSGTEAADVASLRSTAISHIWQGNGIPTAAPNTINTNVDVSSAMPGLTNLSQADEWIFNLNQSLTNKVYVLRPTTSNGIMCIVAGGHSSDLHDGNILDIIRILLRKGCTVPVIQMPGYGPNGSTAHSTIMVLEDGSYCGFQAFLDPIHRTLKQLEGETFSLRAMTGLSGGGWATNLAVALDERIAVSIQVAGTFPKPLRQATGSGCTVSWDEEQGSGSDHGPFWASITYEDTYVMGCSSGRTVVQSCNRLDSTLGYGTAWKKYAGSGSTVVIDRAAALGGTFSFHQYEMNGLHGYHQDCIKRLYSTLGLSVTLAG